MKTRKMGSKLMAMLMAVVMVLGLSITAVAASTTTTIDTTQKGTLTLYKYDYSAASTLASLTKGTGTGETDSDVESAYSAYAIQGVEYTILKVADIDTYTATSGTTKTTEVVYGLNSDVASAIGLATSDAVKTETNGTDTTYYWTSDKISKALEDALAQDLKDSDTTTKDALEKLVSGGTSQTTDATGKAAWTELDLGLYLVVETKVPDQVYSTTDPFFVSIPMTSSDGTGWNYKVVAYPKNQTDYPEITKKVRESSNTAGEYTDTVSSSIGDKLDYRIVSKLPQITSTATYLTQYTFVDTLSAGQDFNGDVTVSFYKSMDDVTAASLGTAAVTLTLDTATPANSEYTVETSTDANGTTITISLTEAGLKKVNEGAAESTSTNGNYSYIVISYTATLNSDAVLGDAGNENDVKLTYGRTSDSYTETIEDKTQVYTFGLDITKAFSDGSTNIASDVEFTLTNSEGEYITGTENASGNYTVTGLTGVATSSDIVFSPASDGSLYIAGLEAGTYTLTEIKTASGYNLLKNPITIKITSKEETITASTVYYKNTGDGNTVTNELDVVETANPTNSSATVNGNEATMNPDGTVTTSTNAAVVIEITNTKGFSLPMTGGEGVWILTILGVLIIGLGAYSLVLRKVKRA